MSDMSEKGRLPDFLIIGAAKSGTTSLHRYLERHPQLFMSTPKEPEFFSIDSVFARGEAWYRDLFRDARDDQVCGEASTSYTRWPQVPDANGRIAHMLPGVKLVYLMRHPVDRSYSQYAHDMRRQVAMTFEQALEQNSMYVDSSLYMKQIRRYLEHYDREAMLFLFSSDLRKNPDGLLRQVQDFLGVPQVSLTQAGPIEANPGGSEYYIRSLTTEPLKKLPVLSWLARTLPPGPRGRLYAAIRVSPLGRWLDRRYQLPPLTGETRRRLIELFKEPNRELAEFVGRDLSEWDS